MNELRVPSRSPHHTTEPQEDAVSGFLNRKCIQEMGAKRSKDRSWQIFWCQVKGSVLDFYKVEGVRPKPQGEPPPRDIYPPPNMLKHKVGFVHLEDALVELDYTSQLHKELQKRRRHLFRLALPNDMEYIFQAPSDNQRTTWVIALQNAARRFEGDDTDFDRLIHQEIKIKAARCSIRQRSRQNVHSFKRVPLRTAGSFDEEYDFSPMTEVAGDPRLLVLKKRLQSKRELLQQFETMYSSFAGENNSMYTDALPFKLKQDGGGVLVGWRGGGRLKGRRHSLPEAQLNTTLEESGGNGSWRASTGDVTVPIIQRTSSAADITDPSSGPGTVTKLVRDYYLVPGAEWSLVREGESVCLLGRTPNGWYRCVALREAEHRLEPIYAPSRSVISGLSEISADSGLPPSASQSMIGVEPMASPIPEEVVCLDDGDVFHDEEEPHPPTVNGNVSHHEHTPNVTHPSDHMTPSNGDVTLPAGPVPPPIILRKKRRPSSVERPLSYQMATDEVTLFFEEECLLTSAASRSHENRATTPDGWGRDRGLTPERGGGDRGADSSEERPQEAIELEPRREEGGPRVDSGQEEEGAAAAPASPIPSDSHLMDSTLSSQEEEAAVGGTSELRHRPRPPASSARDSQTSRDSRARDSLTSSQAFLVLLPPDPAHLHLSSSHPQSRLMSLLAREHRTGRYSIPLLGCVPSSVLKPFSQQPALPSPYPSPSPSPSPSHQPAPPSPSPSPTPSPVHQPSAPRRRPAPVKAASIDIAPSASYTSSADHTHSNGVLLDAKDDPAHDSDDDSALEMPLKKTRSSSLPPPLIQRSPPSSPSGSPVESNLDHSPGEYHRHRPQVSHHLTSSIPEKKRPPARSPAPSSARGSGGSPQRANRSPRRKPYEPIMILLDSGPTLLRKLFTRRKTIPKQLSVPEGETLTIPADSRPSPAPLPPPPALLGDDLGPGMRMQRVASVSGRPVRSTGVGLVIGEESSSESESESEESATSPTMSLHEDSLPSPPHTSPRHMSPQSLPRSVEDASVFGSRETTPPGDLARSALEHDSLKLMASTEQAPPTTQVQSTRRKNATLPSTFRIATLRTKQRTHSDNISPRKARSTRRKKRRSWGDDTTPELPKVTGIFREPPRGEKRFVFLDPQQPKYGFRLESYGRCREKGRVLQTFVQSVAPGSPAFMGGLYPGDAIIEVNGVNVRYAPVEEVVGKISSVPHTSTEKIKLMVEFADGVTRLERMKRADELKYQMRVKQARMKELIAQESKHLFPPSLPSPHSIILAHELTPWGHTPPITEPCAGPFPHSRHLNNVVSLYQGHVTTLAVDALVMPLCSVQDPANERALHKLLHGGGRELLDELALARHCHLGSNITTRGHQLPILSLYHCAFGDLEESLLSCCRLALETANNQKYNTIAFWIDGFTAAKVSPHVVIELVRLWLQEGTNSARFERVVFAAKSSISLVQKFLNRYFPLRPFFPERKREGGVTKGDGRDTVEGGTLGQLTAAESGEHEKSRGLSPSPSPSPGEDDSLTQQSPGEEEAGPTQPSPGEEEAGLTQPSPGEEEADLTRPQSECWADRTGQEGHDSSSEHTTGEPLPITTPQDFVPARFVIGPEQSESQV